GEHGARRPGAGGRAVGPRARPATPAPPRPRPSGPPRGAGGGGPPWGAPEQARPYRSSSDARVERLPRAGSPAPREVLAEERRGGVDVAGTEDEEHVAGARFGGEVARRVRHRGDPGREPASVGKGVDDELAGHVRVG